MIKTETMTQIDRNDVNIWVQFIILKNSYKNYVIDWAIITEMSYIFEKES